MWMGVFTQQTRNIKWEDLHANLRFCVQCEQDFRPPTATIHCEPSAQRCPIHSQLFTGLLSHSGNKSDDARRAVGRVWLICLRVFVHNCWIAAKLSLLDAFALTKTYCFIRLCCWMHQLFFWGGGVRETLSPVECSFFLMQIFGSSLSGLFFFHQLSSFFWSRPSQLRLRWAHDRWWCCDSLTVNLSLSPTFGWSKAPCTLSVISSY